MLNFVRKIRCYLWDMSLSNVFRSQKCRVIIRIEKCVNVCFFQCCEWVIVCVGYVGFSYFIWLNWNWKLCFSLYWTYACTYFSSFLYSILGTIWALLRFNFHLFFFTGWLLQCGNISVSLHYTEHVTFHTSSFKLYWVSFEHFFCLYVILSFNRYYFVRFFSQTSHPFRFLSVCTLVIPLFYIGYFLITSPVYLSSIFLAWTLYNILIFDAQVFFYTRQNFVALNFQ